MMERLDGPLADLVAAERAEIDAIPKSKDAAWAGIAAAWQTPPPVPPTGVAEAATASAGKGGLLKIVAALVVGTSVGAGVWALQEPPSETPLPRVEAPAFVAPVARETPPVPNVDAAPVLAAPPARTPTAGAPPKSVERSSSRPKSTPGLAEELALVDAMRKDVTAGRFSKALSRAKEHRLAFAKGSLIADRMDLEAAARCGRGDLEEGRKLAERKAKRWPRAPVTDRLRTLCRLDKP